MSRTYPVHKVSNGHIEPLAIWYVFVLKGKPVQVGEVLLSTTRESQADGVDTGDGDIQFRLLVRPALPTPCIPDLNKSNCGSTEAVNAVKTYFNLSRHIAAFS